MMLFKSPRLASAGAAALVGVALFAAPALAEENFIGVFIPFRGATSIGASSDTFGGTDPHIEIVRGGTVIARSTGFFGNFGSLEVASLNPGDTINLLRSGAVVGSTTFDGTPTINADACAGRSSFTGTRNALARVTEAGAFTLGRDPYFGGDDTRAIWSQDNPFTVTLDRPLGVGQVAFVGTRFTSGSVTVFSDRQVAVAACPPPPPPPPPPPTSKVPTDAQVLAAVKAALSQTGAKLRKLDTRTLAKRKSIALPFAFPEAGTAKLQLTTKVKRKSTIVGTGSKAMGTAGTANVTVKLTKAGRLLLKRARSIKLTLKATFTPARAGAKPQSASTSVTLKRKKKK
jgi:hypothetical protein